jgi:hypothetical protein
VQASGSGATAAAANNPRSPETYLGYSRMENLASSEVVVQDKAAQYSTPRNFKIDQWALHGNWRISAESASLQAAGGAISYRFQGRDLHLVMGANSDKPIRFKVTLDGVAPGKNHGVDCDENGNGVIHEQRLYQLIRQNDKATNHIFRIEFQDAGAEAFAFTFG